MASSHQALLQRPKALMWQGPCIRLEELESLAFNVDASRKIVISKSLVNYTN